MSMELIQRMIHSGVNHVRDEIAKYMEETAKLPHMLWAFTTDPLVTPEHPYRYSMTQIRHMPLEKAVQQRWIDMAGEDLAQAGWRFQGSDLHVAMFVGPFWPFATPGVNHGPEYPAVILQTWAAGMGVSTMLYETNWEDGRLVGLRAPYLVHFDGEVYADRFAQAFQALAGARRN